MSITRTATATATATTTILVALAACDANQAGNLGATELGDTTHPAQRGSPIEALRAACGEGGRATAGVTLGREPYLQQVSLGGATIGWVTTAPDGASVALTSADKQPVATVAAAVDEAATRAAGESQVWARTSGLIPDTTYCYTVTSGTEPLTLPTGFRTAPLASDPDPVRFLAFGDSGSGSSDQLALLDQMYEFPYDLIIHTGDVAYDNGSIEQFEANVFGVYSDLFRNIPFFPSSGNHEYETLQGAPFRDVFALPGEEKWYSFDWGRVHFAALDTEADYATQIAWLDADLAAAPLPWKVVYLHRPPYSSGYHGSDVRLRDALAPVLERHRVQLVLAGHDHDYERMVPQNGVQHVVTGGGGKGTYPVGVSDFTAFSSSVIHFVYVEVGVDELVLHAVDATGTEFDSVVVPR